MEQSNYTTKEKKFQQITEKERYKIEALREEGLRAKEIAEKIGKDKRTIERELKLGAVEQLLPNKNANRENGDMSIQVVYRADTAQMRHDERASHKGRNLKIGNDHEFVEYIEEKIKKERWSPDAIIGYIKANGIEFESLICTKTLYNYIDMGLFLNISNKDLLRKKNGQKRTYRKVRTVALNNRNGKSIEERPEEINERNEIGHWEIDLVVGKQGTKSVILTLVERKSRKSLYILVKNKTQAEVIKAIKRAAKRVKGDFSQVFKTITTDNGSEFLDGAGIKAACGCDEVYYAHPFSSWEKGSNENGNSILRRFLPKGTDFTKLTRKELQRIEDWVNNYPRKILGYKSANDIYYAA